MNREELEKLFHQPTRLRLMTELCSDRKSKTFAELKESCQLTDGNLSRHLQLLEQAGVVKIEKRFVDLKPLTSIKVTSEGRDQFVGYLGVLEELLRESLSKAGKV